MVNFHNIFAVFCKFIYYIHEPKIHKPSLKLYLAPISGPGQCLPSWISTKRNDLYLINILSLDDIALVYLFTASSYAFLVSAFEIIDKRPKTDITVTELIKRITKLMLSNQCKINYDKIEELRKS